MDYPEEQEWPRFEMPVFSETAGTAGFSFFAQTLFFLLFACCRYSMLLSFLKKSGACLFFSLSGASFTSYLYRC